MPFKSSRTRLLRWCVLAPVFTVSAATSLSCYDSPEERLAGPTGAPVSRSIALSSLQRAMAPTLDDRLDELAERVPGFGGYGMRDDTLFVFLTNPAGQAPLVRETVVPRLAQLGAIPGILPRNTTIAVKQGRFDFRELSNWHRMIGARGVPPGVEFTGVAKEDNRLTFGVADEIAASGVRAHLANLGVPLEAYSIELVQRARPRLQLTDKVRPTDGGFAIEIDRGADLYECTLGLNITKYPDDGHKYFLTASHCSDKAFGADTAGLLFYQPTFAPGNGIGREAVDPVPFTGGSCPVNKVCRWGDASMIKYDTAAHWLKGFAAIANASLSVTGYARFTECCLSGEKTYRTGRASGTDSTATLHSSCLNFFPDSAVWASAGVTIPGNLALLCQYRLSGMPAGEAGDSGGPIFKSGSAQYDPLCFCTSVFWGIYFASNGTYEWFSYVEKISDDLGNFVWKLPYP